MVKIELPSILKRLMDPTKLSIRNDIKPNLAFINDFMNFWPLWHHRIKEIIELEINSSDKIESSF
jgi:hypothetical protein